MQNNGNSERLYLRGGSKITADGDCSHEIKRHLLFGRKAMTKLDGILKSRDITLPTKIHLIKAMVFPIVTYGCESWTIKKAERQRLDAFELWCWRRLLRVPGTARRSNKSILKKINLDYSLEGLMLRLKLQNFGYLMRTANSLEKTLILGKIEGKRTRGQQEDEMVGWHHWLTGNEFEQRTGKPDILHEVHGVAKSQTWLSNWTTKTNTEAVFVVYKFLTPLRHLLFIRMLGTQYTVNNSRLTI